MNEVLEVSAWVDWMQNIVSFKGINYGVKIDLEVCGYGNILDSLWPEIIKFWFWNLKKNP